MPHFDIFYMKKDYIREGIMGVEWCRSHNTLPNPRELGKTHTYVKMIKADDLADVFHKMQAEQWSPNGEACELIKKLDLTHTSMCVGDVIVATDGIVAMVDGMGFQKLNGYPKIDPTSQDRNADRIDGYDRDDLGESPDY